MAEEKDKGFVDGADTIIKEVVLKVNRNNEEQVDKITFNTSGGDITWKPKIAQETYEGGFKVQKTVPQERGMLPEKLVKLASICTEKGQCKAKVFYNFWNTEQDGNPVTYRFIMSEKTFDKWVIVEEDIKDEEVLP